MSDQQTSGTIRNVVEAMWEDLPGHFGGAYSKMLVRPEVCGSRRIDYRISTYQPKGYVETHAHRVQEQIYHILAGEAWMELGTERRSCAGMTSSSCRPGCGTRSTIRGCPT